MSPRLPLAQGVTLLDSLHLHGLKFFLSNEWSGLPLLKAHWWERGAQARANGVLAEPTGTPTGTGCPGFQSTKCLLPNASRTGSFPQAQGTGPATSTEDSSEQCGQSLFSGSLEE